MPKLTAQYVRDLPLAGTGQVLVIDDNLPGFGVRIGTKSKAYFVEGRVKGRSRRVTLGRTDTLQLNEARRRAIKALAEMGDGRDRNAEQRRDRARVMTLRQAATGWLAERPLRPGTSATYRATLNREFGDWMDMELRRITPQIFQVRFLVILARTSTGATLAVRTFQSCWNWARADAVDLDGLPLLPNCPTNIVKAKKLMPKATRKQSFVSDWKALFDALDSIETRSNRHQDAGVKFRFFVELLARTGMRKAEASHLKWANVDMERATLTITADRAKNGEALTLPMSKQTHALLERLRGLTGADLYVWGPSPLGDPRESLTALREALGWSVQFHDFRRSVATIATDLDAQQAKINRILNHSTARNVTLGYQVSKNPESLRGAVQSISDFIDTHRQGLKS